MKCEEKDNLAAFLDGELSPAESGRVRAHLDSCAECRAFARLLKGSYDALEPLEPFDLPAGFSGRMKSRLRRRSRLPLISAAAAALLIVSFVFVRSGFLTPIAPVIPVTAPIDVVSLDDLSPEEIAVIENIEILEDYEILSDLELLAQFETLEELEQFPEIESI